jgi:RNase adaptor protein for sRNA GlmZ degradation
MLARQLRAVPPLMTADRDRLTVHITSFSYLNGIPPDYSGFGGGFVFDCRALPNPGRIEEFKQFTGLDTPVVDFLKENKEVTVFLDYVKKIILQAVNDYRQRHFSRLTVCFGCTGGQHRSVYCAEKIAEYLFDISPSGSYTSEIAYNCKTTPTNVIGAIRGMGTRYKVEESLIGLNMVEERSGGKKRKTLWSY